MAENLKKNWQVYLMELSGLAGFVLIAGILTVFMEHPDLPVMKSSLQDYPLLRRIPLGIILGIYVAVVVLLFGKRSGAHINPSVTWTFYRLGKISFTNACLYSASQFAGAIGAALLLKSTLGNLFSYPSINYGNTEPKPPHGAMTAFIAEFVISFVLMLMVLMVSSSKRFEKYAALLSGILIAIYLIVEIPLSGMSLNPARSFAGALEANEWRHLWIYFAAPTLAMLAAGEIYSGWKIKQTGHADFNLPSPIIKSINSDYIELPNYPVEISKVKSV